MDYLHSQTQAVPELSPPPYHVFADDKVADQATKYLFGSVCLGDAPDEADLKRSHTFEGFVEDTPDFTSRRIPLEADSPATTPTTATDSSDDMCANALYRTEGGTQYLYHEALFSPADSASDVGLGILSLSDNGSWAFGTDSASVFLGPEETEPKEAEPEHALQEDDDPCGTLVSFLNMLQSTPELVDSPVREATEAGIGRVTQRERLERPDEGNLADKEVSAAWSSVVANVEDDRDGIEFWLPVAEDRPLTPPVVVETGSKVARDASPAEDPFMKKEYELPPTPEAQAAAPIGESDRPESASVDSSFEVTHLAIGDVGLFAKGATPATLAEPLLDEANCIEMTDVELTEPYLTPTMDLTWEFDMKKITACGSSDSNAVEPSYFTGLPAERLFGIGPSTRTTSRRRQDEGCGRERSRSPVARTEAARSKYRRRD